MIVWWLEGWNSIATPTAYTSSIGLVMRAILAASIAWWLALRTGPWCIAWLAERFREPNSSDSAQLQTLHQAKHRTPTMGGLFLILATALVAWLLVDLSAPHVWIVLYIAVGFGTIGAVDDWIKVRSARRGLSARAKLTMQTIVAVPAALGLTFLKLQVLPTSSLGDWLLVGTAHSLWFLLILLCTTNAVNLTDGLDGLASGCLLASFGAFVLLMAWGTSSTRVSERELVVLGGGVMGVLCGFLRFNRHPAQVFMGNTGALALGGMLAGLAIASGYELWLALIGGVFVVEMLSVILQVASYRWFGRRLLRCAPLHHHFQFQGQPEPRIVRRFWVAAACCAGLGLVGNSLERCLATPPASQATRSIPHSLAPASLPCQEIALASESQ